MSQDTYRVTTVKWTGRAHTLAFPSGAGGKGRADALWESVNGASNVASAYFFIDGVLTRAYVDPQVTEMLEREKRRGG